MYKRQPVGSSASIIGASDTNALAIAKMCIRDSYNTLRIHEHCDYQSPLNYEKEFNEILKN